MVPRFSESCKKSIKLLLITILVKSFHFSFSVKNEEKFDECTSARLCPAENCNDVDFSWCATKVDHSGKMKEWRKCEDNPIFSCSVFKR